MEDETEIIEHMRNIIRKVGNCPTIRDENASIWYASNISMLYALKCIFTRTKNLSELDKYVAEDKTPPKRLISRARGRRITYELYFK